MSKSNGYETALLQFVFNGTAIGTFADPSSDTVLYISLHTASPEETGDQTTSEATYTGYARVSHPRTVSGFSVSGNTATLLGSVSFPAATGGSETLTHYGIGTDLSGSGLLLYYGVLSPNTNVTSGIIPIITAMTISED